MIDQAQITAGIKSILDGGLSNYRIFRNAERNTDPNLAAVRSDFKGLINVLRGKENYRPHSTGRRFMVTVRPQVEIQAASMTSAEHAEDALQDAVAEVMGVLVGDPTLGGTVGMCIGYDIDYEYNAEEAIWHHSAIITIEAEVRS